MGNRPQDRHEATRKKVYEWLLVRFEHVKDGSSPDTLWHLVAEDANGWGLDVGQVANVDIITIAARVVVTANYRDALANLRKNERWQFLREIKLYLLTAGVDCSGVSDPLEDVTVHDIIPIEALGRDTFLRRIAAVDRAAQVLMILLDRKLAKDGPPSETKAPAIN